MAIEPKQAEPSNISIRTCELDEACEDPRPRSCFEMRFEPDLASFHEVQSLGVVGHVPDHLE